MEDYRAEARRRWSEKQQRPQEPAASSSGQRAPSDPPRGGGGGGAAAAPRAEPGAAGGGDFPLLEQLANQWSAMSAAQQQQVAAGGLVTLVVLIYGSRAVPLLALAALALYLHTRLPNVASFEPFFKEWFTKELFPRISQDLQRKLQERAKTETNIFDSLASQFKGWVMGKTETLQASAWYEMVVKHALPPAYADLFFMRTATVNLGSRSQGPRYVTFWGFHDRWMVSPFQGLTDEAVLLLDELAGQNAKAR